MAIKTETIPCNFIGDFKVGDNLVFNTDLLRKIMEENETSTLNKMIVLQLGSIVEAALSQIIYRAQNYTKEGVPNIPESVRLQIESEEVDTFYKIIEAMKTYKILDSLGEDIYEQLNRLRKYRNKIHIQKDLKIEGASRDDRAAFSDEVRNWALALNIKIMKFLSEKMPRPKELHVFGGQLIFPT